MSEGQEHHRLKAEREDMEELHREYPHISRERIVELVTWGNAMIPPTPADRDVKDLERLWRLPSPEERADAKPENREHRDDYPGPPSLLDE